MLESIDDWIAKGVDLVLVIGTSSKVFPAAGLADEARDHGARVAVVNMDASDLPRQGLAEGDWMFQGDAAQIVPELFKNVIGELGDDGKPISNEAE